MKVGDLVKYREWQREEYTHPRRGVRPLDGFGRAGPGIIIHVDLHSGNKALKPVYLVNWVHGLRSRHTRQWLEVISESR